MMRALKYLILLAALVALFVWLADNPGQVSFEWWGYRVDTSFTVALLALTAVIVAITFVYRVYLFVRGVPGAFGRSRKERKTHKGYEALTRGMVAVAADDPLEARKQARKAQDLLEDPSLTMLLSAQAAQLEGDETAAQKFFEAMAEKKGMEFLGLRGLLNQAMRAGDDAKALDLAKRAYRLKPKTEWLASNLLELQLSNSDWADAEKTLDETVRNKLVDGETGKRRKAILLTRRAREAADHGAVDDAVNLLRKANKLQPAFAPSALLLADLYQRQDKARKALAVLETLWAHQPNPQAFQLYLEIAGEPDALKRVRLVEKFCDHNHNHIESKIARARAALEAHLWGSARKELEGLIKSDNQARVFALMAEIEESEHEDLAKARQWLRKATTADPDPAWVCSHCGHVALEWDALCGNCSEFDGYVWGVPHHASRDKIAGVLGGVSQEGAGEAQDQVNV